MQDQEARLRQEILEDAERKAARVVKRARQDADKLREDMRRDQEKRREARLSETGREADQKACAIRASIDLEISRHALARREQVLEAIFADAMAVLASGGDLDRQRSLAGLLKEAAGAMASPHVVVTVASEDASVLAEQEIREAVHQAGAAVAGPESVSVTVDSGHNRGVLLASADGRERFDNTYAGRLRRMKNPLRDAVYNLLSRS